MKNIALQQHPLFYDQGLTDDLLAPFALTDYFLELVQDTQQPILHFWQLPDTFILGMKDGRLPNLERGLAVLKENHFQPIMRSAGGLGVINDAGVLNVSLFLPNPEKKISIDDAYLIMTSLMQQAFNSPERPIDAFEIVNSYCPGKFDLSIHGLKIAGIAQRRFKEGIAVMLYLSVFGNQYRRGQVVRDFYQATLGDAFGTGGYPAVDPFSMTTLDSELSVVKTQLKETLQHLTGLPLEETLLPKKLRTPEAQASLQKAYASLEARNADLAALLKGGNA